METAIREAVAADIDELVRLHGLFMAYHSNCDERFALRLGVNEKWHERVLAAIESPDALVLIAEKEHEVVGCAYILVKPGALDFGPETVGYLCDVFVEPQHRRGGISRNFLASAQDWLRSRGIRSMEASWAVRAVEARRTWLGLGFEPLSISGVLEF